MARSENTDSNGNSRNGPSNLTITISGIVSLGTLIASGITSYNSIQNDIAALKRGEQYQEKVNEQHKEDMRSMRDEVKGLRVEQRETMREFGEKVDRLIDKWPRRSTRDEK